ncbi:MAG: hypothetical protein ACP5MZ_03925 [Candidatus Micrarchaeia archaeon]
MDKDAERFLEYVYINSQMLHKSMLASLERAIDMLDRGNMRNKMSTARNMIACGEDANSAIGSQLSTQGIRKRADTKYVRVLSYLNGKDFGAGIADVHRELVAERNLNMSVAYGSLQKYLSANMLFGTILPSMAMFGFVGYSLINYSNMVMFLLIFAMLVVIPAAYAVLQNKLRSLNV